MDGELRCKLAHLVSELVFDFLEALPGKTSRGVGWRWRGVAGDGDRDVIRVGIIFVWVGGPVREGEGARARRRAEGEVNGGRSDVVGGESVVGGGSVIEESGVEVEGGHDGVDGVACRIVKRDVRPERVLRVEVTADHKGTGGEGGDSVVQPPHKVVARFLEEVEW